MPRPKISTFRISRVQGRSENWRVLNLLNIHVDALNEIGHTGFYKGVRITLQEFFETYIETPKCFWRIEELESNREEFTDRLLVIRVTL
jgi:hypothetical protein